MIKMCTGVQPVMIEQPRENSILVGSLIAQIRATSAVGADHWRVRHAPLEVKGSLLLVASIGTVLESDVCQTMGAIICQ